MILAAWPPRAPSPTSQRKSFDAALYSGLTEDWGRMISASSRSAQSSSITLKLPFACVSKSWGLDDGNERDR